MDTLRRALMLEEGYRGSVYLCPAGKRTIGYGHNLDDVPLTDNDREAIGMTGDTLTRAQAEALLVRDINALVVPAASHYFGAAWETFGEVRRAALGSMIYQLGAGGFGKFRSLLASVKSGDWHGAAVHAADSLWARQTPARARRVCIALATNTDVWRLVR